jgi:hypothetical protein
VPTYDKQIKSLESEIARQQERMERVRREFVAATTSYAQDAIRLRVEDVVVAEHQHSHDLGVEGLSAVKTDLGHLLDQVPRLVEQHVGADRLWPHASNDASTGLRWYSHASIPAGLGKPTLVVIARATTLLQAHGYRVPNPSTRGSVQGSDRMRDLLERYVEMAEPLSRLRAQLAETRTAKAASAVEELWRKA